MPVIKYPIHIIEIPSNKTKAFFRPFTSGEEKLLLLAKESQDETDILMAVRQIITNCKLDEKLDVDKLTIFDLEYIFLNLRSVSVDSKVSVSYTDNEDKKTYDFDIDLNDVKVIYPSNEKNIKVEGTNLGIIMKYPSASLYGDKGFLNITEDYVNELIARCVDKIYDGEEIYEASAYTSKEILEFIVKLDLKSLNKIQTFLLNLPKLSYTIKYKNSLEHDREIELASLNDFFTLR